MNKNFIHYKDYIAELSFDLDENIIVGKVVNAVDIISFHGKTLTEAKEAFHDVLDSYLEVSISLGIQPQKPCSGKFNLRITPELHRKLTLIASTQSKSLNECTQDLINTGIAEYEKEHNMHL